MDALTPHQLQTYWTVKELFPRVSGEAILANVAQGTERLAEMCMAGALPSGDEFVHDSDAPIAATRTREQERREEKREEKREERREEQPAATGGFWAALTGSLTRIAHAFAPREPDDAEPPLTDEERARLERVLEVVDEELFNRASAALPTACPGWILLNLDFGLDYLLAHRVPPLRSSPLPVRRVLRGVRHVEGGRVHFNGIEYWMEDTPETGGWSWVDERCSRCGEYDTSRAVACTSTASTGGWRFGRAAAAAAATHSFCADCVRGHAAAAVEQHVIAPSGIGLKCMQPGCANVLLRAHVEQVLDARTRTALEPHYAHEALTAAGLRTESCPRCGFTAHLSESPEERQVFGCQECSYEYCRRCNRAWDEKHRAKSCEEMDDEEQASKEGVVRRVLMWFGLVSPPEGSKEAALRKYRAAAERMTAMTVHACPRCKKAFVKSSACNKITCPCGQASCYVCGEAIDGYAHFRGRADACSLWEDTPARESAAAAAELQREIAAAGSSNVAKTLRLLQ